MNNNITVLLLLKDRHSFTERWLKVHNELGFSIPIHIADGSLTDRNRHIVQEFLKSDPNLNIEYKFYGKDLNLKCFYEKIFTSASNIKTDYIILTCNDDFLVEESIKRGSELFQKDEELVAVSGPVYDTTICITQPDHNHVWGILSKPINKYPSFDRLEKSALARLQNFIKGRKSSYIWSALHKKEIFLKTCEDILEINPVDLRFHAHLFILLTLARGKVNGSLPCMTIHQNNPGESAGKTLSQIGTWYDWIQTKNWFSSYQSMISKLGDIILNNETNKEKTLRRDIEFIYQSWIGEQILRSKNNKYLKPLYDDQDPILKEDLKLIKFSEIENMVSSKSNFFNDVSDHCIPSSIEDRIKKIIYSIFKYLTIH